MQAFSDTRPKQFADQHDLRAALQRQLEVLSELGAPQIFGWSADKFLRHGQRLIAKTVETDPRLWVFAVVPSRDGRYVGVDQVRWTFNDRVCDYERHHPRRPYVVGGLTLSWDSMSKVRPCDAHMIMSNTNAVYSDSCVRGLTMAEGLSLAFAYPELLKTAMMVLVGSVIGKNHVPAIRRGQDGRQIVVEAIGWEERPLGTSIAPCCEDIVRI